MTEHDNKYFSKLEGEREAENIPDSSLGLHENLEGYEEDSDIIKFTGVSKMHVMSEGRSNGVVQWYLARKNRIIIGSFALLSLLFAMIALGFSEKFKNMFSEEDSHVTRENNLFASYDLTYAPLPTKPIRKIAFGSCNSQKYPAQPHWETLLYGPFKPDLLIFMGDNVYGDCNYSNCSALEQAYRDLAQHASYQAMIREIPILATLDDHDYGASDADRFNPHKDKARSLFHEFFQLNPEDYARRQGVYNSKEFFIDEGDNAVIQFILLDTRYSRDKFVGIGDNGQYIPDFNETQKNMLDDEQWLWLEEQLQRPAVLRILVSSIQALADGNDFECWRMLPYERKRLISMLTGANGGQTVIVSGDHHVGGIYKVDSENDGSREFIEITASSWTHTLPLGAYGSNCTTAEECDEVDANRLYPLVRENNFGSIEIDWNRRKATFAIRRTNTSPGYMHPAKLSDAGEIIQQIDVDL